MPIVEVSLPMVGWSYSQGRKYWNSNYHNRNATGYLWVGVLRSNALGSTVSLKWFVVAVVLQN